MEGEFRNAIVCEAGEYEFTGERGERYRYLTLYNGRENLQLTVREDCDLPVVVFGDRVNLWFEVQQGHKPAGDNRTLAQTKLRILNVEKVNAGAVQPAEQEAV